MGKFEIYKDKRGEYRFRLKARNGQIILASEGYTTRASCENGIDSVRENARLDSRFERSTKGGLYRFNLKSRNGQVIGTSESYSSSSSRNHGIQSVKKNSKDSMVMDLS